MNTDARPHEARLELSPAYVLMRFTMKAATFVIMAALQSTTDWGSLAAFHTMTLVAAAGCATIAAVRGERVTSHTLTYWDETAAFLLLAAAVGLVTQ